MKKSEVRNVYVLTDLLILAPVLTAGCVMLPFGPEWRAIGIVIIACGLCICPFFRHGYKIQGINGVFHVQDIPVSRENEDAIMSFLHDQASTLKIGSHIQGGAVVSIYTRKGREEIYAQYYDYVKVLAGEHLPVVQITPQKRDELLKLKPKTGK